MVNSTQAHVLIEDIRENLVFLKDGGVSLIITTSAVNFGLLFETEQISIIDSFAGMLNSLSFPIQIVIISRRLDVSAYLDTIEKAKAKQTNPLLIEMTDRYHHFVESLIKEKNVLEKKFYVTLSVTGPELGFFKKSTLDRSKKAITLLDPRKDHILRQLSRIGLKARQLTSEELIKLFYDIYNPEFAETEITKPVENIQPRTSPTSFTNLVESLLPHPPTPAEPVQTEVNQEPSPVVVNQIPTTPQLTVFSDIPTATPITNSTTPSLHPLFAGSTVAPVDQPAKTVPASQANTSGQSPFVVEELP